MNNYIQCAACGHVGIRHKEKCDAEECTCPGFIDPGPGNLTCPRRMFEMGPWSRQENLDHWSTSRWGSHYPHQWPEGFVRPRSCSFCGGAHPDDAIGLMAAGWEVERTGKSYKRYIQPPGFGDYQKALVASIRDQGLDTFEYGFVLPTPPVKIYISHFDQDQIDRFNAALKERQ